MATYTDKDIEDRKITKAIVHLLHIRKRVLEQNDDGEYHYLMENGTYVDGINDAIRILGGESPKDILK